MVVELDFDAGPADGDVGVVAERVEEDVFERAALDGLLQRLAPVVAGLVRPLVGVGLPLAGVLVAAAGDLAEAAVTPHLQLVFVGVLVRIGADPGAVGAEGAGFAVVEVRGVLPPPELDDGGVVEDGLKDRLEFLDRLLLDTTVAAGDVAVDRDAEEIRGHWVSPVGWLRSRWERGTVLRWAPDIHGAMGMPSM